MPKRSRTSNESYRRGESSLISIKSSCGKLSAVIYTLGYQALTPARVCEIVLVLDAVLLDCRFKPVSRIPGFGHRQLGKLMLPAPGGIGSDNEHQTQHHSRYVRMGDMLSGHGHTTASGIRALQPCADDQAACVLLCMEEHPADCHRHRDITGPHFRQAMHIYRDRLFTSAELSGIEAGQLPIEQLRSGDWDYWLELLVDPTAKPPVAKKKLKKVSRSFSPQPKSR